MRFPAVPFSTMVIGSLPRPRWVWDVIDERLRGCLSQREAESWLDRAVLSAIAMQDQAGLDYIADGEWRRENYTRVFADRVGGFRRETVESGSLTLHAFVTETITQRGPIVSEDAEFLRRHTDRKTLVALPSPCTIGDLLWHPVYSAPAYPTREAFVEACVPFLRDEIVELARLGVDAIQVDEPLLPRLADPSTYGLEEATDRQAAVELCVRTIEQLVVGLDDVFLSVHLCHAHGAEYQATPDAVGLIASAVERLPVDRVAMEFNSPAARALQSLDRFPPDKMLGLGVIDPQSSDVETPEVVVERVEHAMKFVEKERLTLNPDCGFATSASNRRDLDRAYRKLVALCRGAELLRKKHAG